MRNWKFLTMVAGAVLLPGAHIANAPIVEESSIGAPATISPASSIREGSAPRIESETIVLAQAHTPHISNAPQVFLLKGLADVFSAGMDTLAAKLAARGIHAR